MCNNVGFRKPFSTESTLVLFYFNLRVSFCVGDCHEPQKIVGESQILLFTNLLLKSSVFLDIFLVLCYITPHSNFGLFTFQNLKANKFYECQVLLAEIIYYYFNKPGAYSFSFDISGLFAGICGQKKLPNAALRI